jgi:acetamidase/formamidase
MIQEPRVEGRHRLSDEVVHYAWDNSIPARLTVESGGVVEFDTRDASDGYYHPGSGVVDIESRPPFRGHPLTGPLAIAGAHPGDVLAVHVLSVDVGSFGWTVITPGRGFLADTICTTHFQPWDLSSGATAVMSDRVRVPIRPFCGVLGVAGAQPGSHGTILPRRTGGNLDVKQLTAGSTLFLPVEVEGALFSVGDVHAAQGDGEVCNNGIETSAKVVLQFEVLTGYVIEQPQLVTRGKPCGCSDSHRATVVTAPTIELAARDCVRHMIRFLVATHGLTEAEAYVVCSVAGDLKISQTVNGAFTVALFMPEGIFSKAGASP